MSIQHVLLALLVLAIAFILVSRFIEEATVRLIGQIVLGALLVLVVLRFLGVAG